ncbi:tetratricopeptide repeat protein [Streptosporangium sp. NPDC004379]|uniref:tetratricopeptide repeat protein n=1 Tax=Streptosporangium sp. NPDC004379 TaxID=3366189 RepID=UPI00367E8E97
MVNDGGWDRRSVLRGAAALAGAAAAVPLLGSTAAAAATTGSGDADALFKAGKFEQAARAYEEILKQDPANLHAARRRGHIALLSNRFPDAEKHLKTAVQLAPGDKEANRLLADCYIRQDKLSLSAPHWRAAGEESYATWFAAFTGEPYRIHGDTARLPWQQMDPIPLVEASVNGGPAKRFTFYTGAPYLHVSATVAREAGLNPIVSEKIDYLDGVVWAHYGALDSLRLGGIELRDVPVSWSSTESGADVDTDSDGMIGIWVLYHLLTTFDYAGRQLILRRRTPETAAEARAAAARAGAGPLPMWLTRENSLHSRGSLAGLTASGPQVVGTLFGGQGEVAAVVLGDTSERLRIRTDRDRPVETFAGSHPAVAYPCYPKEIRLGDATAREVYCYANPDAPLAPNGFDVPVAFFHCFHKPSTATLDFTDMNLYYIARGKAA